MKGILVTLFSVTALVSAATINTLGCHTDPSEAPAICKTVGSEGVLVAHEKCNHFYKCSHGKPVALICPNDLLYNPKLQYCDWPRDVDCGDRIIPEHNDDDKESNEIQEDKDEFDNSGHYDPSQAPVICARPGSDGALIAHEYCTQFYKCFQSHPVAIICPSSLHYNIKLQLCDWPKNVDCGDRLIYVEDDNNGSGSGHENEGPESDKDADDENVDEHEDEGYPDPSEAPNICKQDNSDSVLVAHELCDHYYICVHRLPFPVICPHGLHFNPKGRICDWPFNVECGSRIIPKEITDKDYVHSKEEKVIHSDPSKASEICAEHENVLVAHEFCNNYYHCAGGKPVARRCPPGLVYNYNIEQCDWPNYVECGNRIISDYEENDKEPENVTEKDVAGHDDPSQAPVICGEEESNGVLVAHEICNKFYICVSGAPLARQCPKGLLYKPSKERCDWPDLVTCGDRAPPVYDDENCDQDNDDKVDDHHGDYEGNYDPSKAPEICFGKGSDGILIAHEYCNQFYICVNNRPVSMECPNSLLFNPKRDECDWASNVNCGGRLRPIESNNVVANTQDSNYDQHEPKNFQHSNIARKICGEEESDGKLIGHEYCTKFYQCVGRQPVTMNCPSVLQFSPEAQHCDWPENVDCGDRIIPEAKDDDAEKNESDEKDHEHVSNNYDDPSQARAICAEENSDGIHIAHEDCNKFYICVNHHPFARECPENLWFNPKIERCDWQYKVQCSGSRKQ